MPGNEIEKEKSEVREWGLMDIRKPMEVDTYIEVEVAQNVPQWEYEAWKGYVSRNLLGSFYNSIER